MDDIAEGMTIGDHFLVTRKLGAGGMGEVYLAQNLNLPDKRYAIKVLRKELTSIERYARLLESEAQKQAKLEHDNLVQLYDYFRWQQRYCLILAYIEGTTLAAMIEAQPDGLQEAVALDLMIGVLRGLNYAHEHGVLHCDIKPANVLVDADGRARVTDFGIARDISPAAPGEKGLVVGTPEYMSPEQIENPDRVDHRSDVFSAGVMFFEMLTGQLPFAAGGDVRFPQLESDATDIGEYRKDLSSRLASIVATAVQRDPAARFQGCIQFEDAIVRYRRGQRWRRTWLPVLVVLSVLAVAGTIGSYQWKLRVEQTAVDERHKNERVAEQERLTNEARERKTIEASIATAVRQLGSLCRESARLKAREDALPTAVAADFPEIIAKLRTQIGDMRKNMSDYSSGYAQALAQLARSQPSIVAEMMLAHPRQDPESARFLDTVRTDHTDLAANKVMRRPEIIVAACPK